MTITKKQAVQLAREVGGFQMPSGSIAMTPEQLERLIKLARNQALDEAKRATENSSNPLTAPEVRIKRMAISSIEYLKDNTP